MRNEIEIVDAQVHTWEPVPTKPWHPIDYGGQVKPGGSTMMAVPYDRVLHAMDAVGVDAAILYTSQDYRRPLPGGAYEFVNDYAEEAIAAHPTRFAAITHVNHQAPDLDERVAAVKKRPATLAIRVLILDRDLAELRGGGYDRLFAAAARHSVPMFMYISGHIPEAGRVARIPAPARASRAGRSGQRGSEALRPTHPCAQALSVCGSVARHSRRDDRVRHRAGDVGQ
jgi:predicted TIM-barrel fold metal-dependent hydrolase